MLKGKRNKEIENTLFIAMGTVKNHIYSIYQKIGVKNRAQLLTLFKNLQVQVKRLGSYGLSAKCISDPAAWTDNL